MDFPRMPVKTLFDQVLTGNQASFDIQNIDQTYAHLEIFAKLRCDVVTTRNNGSIFFNNDTAAHYDEAVMIGFNNNATVGEFADVAIAGFVIHDIAGSTASANVFGHWRGWILDYSGTTGFKNFQKLGGIIPTTGTNTSYFVDNLAGTWRDQSAITRITIKPSTGNFVAGSRVTLIGHVLAA